MFKKEVKKEQEEPLYKRIISYVVSILCLLLCLYITIEVINANTHQRPPRIFGVSVSYVPTASMEPTIKAGEYIMFKKADFNSVEVGDIVIYYNDDESKYIVHRVMEKNTEQQYLIMKGDNNAVEDSLEVKPSMIYGKYITTLGFMTIFSGGINQNLIFFILVGIFLVMLVMQIASIVIKGKTDELKKEQEEQKKLLLEEMKKEILAEELAKLRAQLQNTNTSPSNEEKTEKTPESDVKED